MLLTEQAARLQGSDWAPFFAAETAKPYFAALDAFAAHARAHFGEEDEWMRSSNFPPGDCHIDEHAKVLASVDAVREALLQGDVALCRELALALQDWFPGHVQHLDSSLAAWLVQRSHGGRPLVLRRKSAGA